MRRVAQTLAVLFGVVGSGLVVGLLGFMAWVGASPAGARWLLDEVQDWAPRAGWAELEVAGLEGRLIGPLRVQSLALRLPGVELQVTALDLDWSPAALLRGQVRVSTLSAQEVVLKLSDRVDDPPEPPSTAAPAIPQLPVSLALLRARVGALLLQWPGQEAAQRVEQIELDDFSWAGESFSVGRLQARNESTGTLLARFDARLAAASAQIESLSLTQFLPDDDTVAAQVLAQGELRLDDLPSALELRWSKLQWPPLGAPEVFSPEGRLSVSGTLDDLRAQGRIGLGEKGTIDLDGRYAAQVIAAQLDWTTLAWPLTGPARVASSKGRLELSGTVDAYQYTLDAMLAAEGKDGRAQASGSGGLERLAMDKLRLAVGEMAVSGRAAVAWQPVLVVDADLLLKNLNPGLIDPAWPGRLNGRLKADTSVVDAVPRGQFELALADSELRGYVLRLDARGNFAGGDVDIEALELRSGGTRLTAQGRVTPPFDVQARLDSPDLAALAPQLRGKAQLDARLRGDLDAPWLVAKGSASGLKYDDMALDALSLDADIALDGAWTLDLEALAYSGPAQLDRAVVTLRGAVGGHRLSLAAQAPQGALDLAFAGAFDRPRLAWTGTLDRGRLAPADLPPWTLDAPAALRLDAVNSALAPACWSGGKGRICAQGLRDAERLRAELALTRLDFSDFAAFVPEGWMLTGGIAGTGAVELRDGALADVQADLLTEAITLGRDGDILLRALPGKLRVTEAQGSTLAELRLPLEQGLIAFDGRLGADAGDGQRSVNGLLNVDLPDLAFLRLASPEIERVEGRLAGRMQWSGTLAAPRSQGEIRLEDGRLHLATPGIALHPLSARIVTVGDGRYEVSADASSGGGTLELRGGADLTGAGPSADLRIRGKDFQAANTVEARAWVSPELQLELRGTRLKLTGDLEVPRAAIAPVSFDGGVGPSSDQVIVGSEAGTGSGGALDLSADVNLKLGEQVNFDGFGLTTRLEGNVRAILQPGRADSGRGEVRLIGGRYKAYGQDLQIQTGRLLFTGGPLTEPALEIRALRKPRVDIEVGIYVRGTLDRPEFQLYSTPAMPRERQLSWLVLGRSLDEGSSGGEKALVANAALSLGLSGTDYLAQGLRKGLSLDEISIGAQPGEDAAQARFTVGKYLSPKLYVSYGVGIFQPGQVFKLLYDLGRGFKLSTESGVQTGGDLLYTVERP